MSEKITGDLPAGRVLVVHERTIDDMEVIYEVVGERSGSSDAVRLDFVRIDGKDDEAGEGDTVVPRSFKATVTDPPGPIQRRVTLLVEMDGAGDGTPGTPGVVQYSVQVREGAMGPEEVKSFDLSRYLDAAMRAASRPLQSTGTGAWREPPIRLALAGEVKGRAGRRPLSDDVMRKVAELYTEAVAAGVPTARYLSERMEDQPSINAARRRIFLARQRGFLPPVRTTEEEG